MAAALEKALRLWPAHEDSQARWRCCQHLITLRQRWRAQNQVAEETVTAAGRRDGTEEGQVTAKDDYFVVNSSSAGTVRSSSAAEMLAVSTLGCREVPSLVQLPHTYAAHVSRSMQFDVHVR